MKTAAAMCVVERKPYLFRGPGQTMLCILAAAAAFAGVENFLYLSVYIPHPRPAQVFWRWSVCLPLHVGCTAIAGMGVARVWPDLWARRARPRLTVAFPYLVAAIVVHGAYNAFAVGFELAHRRL